MSLGAGRKRVLLVLFFPSVEPDGVTPINHDYLVGRDTNQGEVSQVIGNEYFAIRHFEED
jgi:hypothetical protein